MSDTNSRHKVIQKTKKDDRFKKTKLCPRFSRGMCQKGEECNFAHGENELKQQVNLQKTKMCSNGKECSRPNCTFAHDESELRFTDDYYKTNLCIQY